MKRLFSIAALLLVPCLSMMAQNPYMNANYMQRDLAGTARYVGMGGALGALGADISSISDNPAALGLYRKSDIALSFSVLTQHDKPNLKKADMTHMSFDQLGFVFAMPVGNGKLNFFNFGFNYQKKANFDHAFIADHTNTNGLSQTTQMANLWNFTTYSTPLLDLMYDAYLVNPTGYEKDNNGNFILDAQGNKIATGYDGFLADCNQYDRVTEGGIHSYEFNLSTNVSDRFYVGATFGVDNVDYYSYSTYREFFDYGRQELYSLYNTQSVSGYGLNAKFGFIVRPIEYSAFRMGLTVETPTVYHLESSVGYSVDSPMSEDASGNLVYGELMNYRPEEVLANLQMRITTPWKVRVALGHTIANCLALGAEYEYANYAGTKQAYEDRYFDDYYGEWHYGNKVRDPDMNDLTKKVLKGSHALKLGMELNAYKGLNVRAGYNYYTAMFEGGAYLDQTGPSPAFGYQTSTDYMNLGDLNIVTAGFGYRGKHFYADVAYMYRMQSGDFYAHADGWEDGFPDGTLTPVDVNLNRHQVFFSLGYKF